MEKKQNSVGRPLKYTEEYIDKVQQYIDSCFVIPEENGKFKVKLPSLEGCSLFLEINLDTIYDWSRKYPKFSEIIDKLRKTQANFLLNYGLGGQFNPTIAKVILSKHGYREGIDTDLTSNQQTINTVDPTVVALAQEFEKKMKESLK